MSLASYRDAKTRSCDRMRAQYDSPRLQADGTPVAGVWQGNRAPLYDNLQPGAGAWEHAVLVDPILPHDVAECREALTRMSDAGFARMPGGPAGTSASRFFFFRAGAS